MRTSQFMIQFVIFLEKYWKKNWNVIISILIGKRRFNIDSLYLWIPRESEKEIFFFEDFTYYFFYLDSIF
jgi:hypothetical protein